jgi:hypothetical protein
MLPSAAPTSAPAAAPTPSPTTPPSARLRAALLTPERADVQADRQPEGAERDRAGPRPGSRGPTVCLPHAGHRRQRDGPLPATRRQHEGHRVAADEQAGEAPLRRGDDHPRPGPEGGDGQRTRRVRAGALPARRLGCGAGSQAERDGEQRSGQMTTSHCDGLLRRCGTEESPARCAVGADAVHSAVARRGERRPTRCADAPAGAAPRQPRARGSSAGVRTAARRRYHAAARPKSRTPAAPPQSPPRASGSRPRSGPSAASMAAVASP